VRSGFETVRAPAESENAAGSPCTLCDARDAALISRKDRHGRPLRTVLCRGCGLAWSDPLPAPDSLASYYREHYRWEYQGTYRPRRVHIYRNGRNALERFRQLRRWLPPQARVLDVGSGGGELLYLLGREGCRATGVEPHAGYAEFAIREYGLDVRIGSVEQIELEAASFDLIALYHVLEHTACPAVVLARLRQWLKPTGVLAVEVPNLEATCQAPNHRFHRAHLFHFNRATLTALGRREGFFAEHAELSPDGGNLFVVFRPAAPAPVDRAALRENFERVRKQLEQHTWLRHYASPLPYLRAVRRLMRAVNEHRAVRGRRRGREILEACFATLPAA
jgi:SAM-dependent methyltransferase